MPSRPLRSALHATLGAFALLLSAGTLLILFGVPDPRTVAASAEEGRQAGGVRATAALPERDSRPDEGSHQLPPPQRVADGRRVPSTPAGMSEQRSAPAEGMRTAAAPVQAVRQSRQVGGEPESGPLFFVEDAPPPPRLEFEPIGDTVAKPWSPQPPTPAPASSDGATPPAESGRVEAQLVGLQRQIEQLAQAQAAQQQVGADRMLQLMQQLQTSNQLQDIKQQLQQIQQAGPAPGPVPPPAPAPTPEGQVSPARPAENADPAPVLRVDPSADGPEQFSLQIQDADIRQVLEMLGQLSGENILVGTGVSGRVSANLQNVTLDEALRGVLRAQGYVHERDERFIFVMTAAEAQQRKLLSRKLVTKIYRPNYISARDLEKLITPLLTPTVGRVAVTIPSEAGIKLDRESAGGDNQSQPDALLVQDYAEVVTEIDGVFSEMDVPPMQVVIESMILSVRLSDDMRFGVNFALLNKLGNGFLVSGDGAALGGSSGFPGVSGTIPVPPVAGSPFTAIPGGLKLGFLQGDMAGFIQALESIADTNLIASPQLRVLNKQRAELIIGNRIGYSTTTINGNTAIQNVNFLDSGTKLLIRPYIAPDGLVRMEVHPERSAATINTQTNLPDLETTEVTTNVMIRDGSTVVIGGLIVEETLQSSDRVPFLGAMPLVGNLFRSRVDQNVRSELIVLITPRIVREPEAAIEGETIRNEAEMRADYFRDHLVPINRRNLARMYYEAAERNYERGRLDQARFEIRESLRLDKNDLPALRLRQVIEADCEQRQQPWLRFRSDEPAPDARWEVAPPEPGTDLVIPPPAPGVEAADEPRAADGARL